MFAAELMVFSELLLVAELLFVAELLIVELLVAPLVHEHYSYHRTHHQESNHKYQMLIEKPGFYPILHFAHFVDCRY
ncbi:MAG: hypothetical protein ACKO46_04500 [Alphaproteobacteria bacterium]